MKIRNTFIIFIVSGFWHGANWTFIIWGVLNAVYILPSIISNTNRNNLEIVAKGRLFPTVSDFFAIISTFGLTVFAWIFFRANNVSHAFNYIAEIFSASLFTIPSFEGDTKSLVTAILIGLFVLIEWLGREDKYAIEKLGMSWKKPVRWGFYYSVVILIFLFTGENQTFIYFQF